MKLLDNFVKFTLANVHSDSNSKLFNIDVNNIGVKISTRCWLVLVTSAKHLSHDATPIARVVIHLNQVKTNKEATSFL